jgi:hypothetical protein
MPVRAGFQAGYLGIFTAMAGRYRQASQPANTG